MFFSDDFLDSIDTNPTQAILEASYLLENFIEQFEGSHEWSNEEHEAFLETSILIETIIENYGLSLDFDFPSPTGDRNKDCSTLQEHIGLLKPLILEQATEMKVQTLRNKFKTALKSSFAYEFSQGDLNRIQTLINELRDHISESKILESSHKNRLLKRLEKLQSELHKRVSDLDRFWGMIGDAGVVLGKLGTDAKPIVDRIREISEIVWNTQARIEELPSNLLMPFIAHNNRKSSTPKAELNSKK